MRTSEFRIGGPGDLGDQAERWNISGRWAGSSYALATGSLKVPMLRSDAAQALGGLVLSLSLVD